MHQHVQALVVTKQPRMAKDAAGREVEAQGLGELAPLGVALQLLPDAEEQEGHDDHDKYEWEGVVHGVISVGKLADQEAMIARSGSK